MIENIERVLRESMQVHTEILVRETSTQLLGVLKKQLQRFLEENSLPVTIVENADQWRNFLGATLELVSESPINLKQKKHKAEVANTPLQDGEWVVIEISIVKTNMGKGTIFCMRVLTRNSTTVIIPITP